MLRNSALLVDYNYYYYYYEWLISGNTPVELLFLARIVGVPRYMWYLPPRCIGTRPLHVTSSQPRKFKTRRTYGNNTVRHYSCILFDIIRPTLMARAIFSCSRIVTFTPSIADVFRFLLTLIYLWVFCNYKYDVFYIFIFYSNNTIRLLKI